MVARSLYLLLTLLLAEELFAAKLEGRNLWKPDGTSAYLPLEPLGKSLEPFSKSLEPLAKSLEPLTRQEERARAKLKILEGETNSSVRTLYNVPDEGANLLESVRNESDDPVDLDTVKDMLKESIGAVKGKEGSAPSKVMGIALNGKDDLNTMRSSLVIGIGGGFAILLAFCKLRKMFPSVYQRSRHGISMTAGSPDDRPELSESTDAALPIHLELSDAAGCCEILRKVWQCTPDDEVQLGGLDAWSLLEFCRLNCRIITLLAPIFAFVLLPLHYFRSRGERKNLGWLCRLDIGNLAHEENVLWIHAFVVWLVVLVCAWQIVSAHEEFTERRYHWLQNISRPRSTTLMVRNIPHMYRSDKNLKEYFEKVFNDDGKSGSSVKRVTVERAYVVRKTGRLPQLLRQLENERYSCALAKRAWENANSPDKDADETKCLEKSRRTVEQRRVQILREQAAIEEVVQGHLPDPKVCSSSGFVTFTSEIAQRMACREQYTRDGLEFRTYNAPDVDDVIYENLAEDELNATSWRWIGVLSLLAVFIFWVPVVVAISGWTTLSSIQSTAPIVKAWMESFPAVRSLLSGVLATAALKCFMACLPSILHYIIDANLHLKTQTSVQLRLQSWLTAFLLIFVVLVTSLGRGITITLVIIAKEPAKFISLLAASLPSSSHFYFTYVILGYVAAPLEMLRLPNLFKYLFYSKVQCLEDQAAKEFSEPEDPANHGMGIRLATVMLMSSISFVFCSCSPLTFLFTWFWFVIAQTVFSYLLIFGESKKPDSGGFFWLQVLEQLFVVLALYVVLMVGVLHALGEGFVIGPPAVAFSSLLCLYAARWRVKTLVFDHLPMEELVKCKKFAADGHEHQGCTSRYIQPECDPLVVEEREHCSLVKGF
eukprot:TRINITY_DN52215_c0_g1_i1.p1 TRINITY_DN52215_c0_g1~~TRINITY_DN52215_c0_g1_i1.p1  ORF type:complete len:883 (+),score=166.90 TRINITY_DN52215_c0_g1_i1:51-2699(+)